MTRQGKTKVILVVDDDPLVRASLSDLLGRGGHTVACAESVADAERQLARTEFALVLLDVYLQGQEGFALLEAIEAAGHDTAVVMMSGYGTIRAAVKAMKAGAADFLTKPLDERAVMEVVGRVLASREDHGSEAEDEGRAEVLRCRNPVVGQDPRMRRALDIIEAIGGSNTTILITGESGTGKSLTARAIHERSSRRGGPFIEVSCGAIPEGLLESELFGHVAGAFTGAVAARQGRFLAADGGTIFLDEIDSASPALQVKLLRVLQERQFEPVGSTETLRVDVRVVLATNADLRQAVREGRFRQDLYYRINVINIELPPLRKRRGDIPLLAEYMLCKYARAAGRRFGGFTDDAVEVLKRHAWPGNVRELENVVERAVLLGHGPWITPDDFPEEMLESARAPQMTPAGMLAEVEAGQADSLKSAMRGPERQLLEEALRANNGNRQETARMLKINRTTLYKKMKRYGLLAPAGEPLT